MVEDRPKDQEQESSTEEKEQIVGEQEERAEEASKDAAASAEEAPEAAEEVKEEEEKIPFEIVETTNQPGSVVDYKLRIAYEEYDKRLSEIFGDLRKSVIVEGFRRGKAPLKLVKIRYGKDARRDALDKVFPLCVNQLVKEQELTPIKDPTLKSSQVEEGKPIELTISMEIRPKIKLTEQDYKAIAVNVEQHKITDETVEQQLEQIRRANAAYDVKKRGKVKEGDAVVLDIRVRDEHGREISEMTNTDVFFKEPSRSLPKPVCEALVDMKKGDKAEAKVERERKTPKGEIASRHDTYSLALKEIKVIQLPTLDDEFAKDVGDFQNLTELRAHINSNLEKQEVERQRSDALSKIYEHLITKVPFDAPASLVAAYQLGMIREDSERLARMGLKLSDLGEETKEYLQRKAEDSIRLVKTLLLLGEIARLEKIEVTDEDVDKEIERMAVLANRKPLAIRARLEAEKRLDMLKDDLLNEKVAQLLFSNANVSYTAA